jgi:hypothetical protein
MLTTAAFDVTDICHKTFILPPDFTFPHYVTLAVGDDYQSHGVLGLRGIFSLPPGLTQDTLPF